MRRRPRQGRGPATPGQVVFGGFDLEDVTSFFLTVDVKAGNYFIVAEDSDVETPGLPKEFLAITVR